jgi:alpha/beta superfamily hydrolase
MQTLKTTINSGGLLLEACLDLPGVPGQHPGVVLCHPHPLYGGNMDNNVIRAVSRALVGAGIASLRFNFRGVGNSQGAFDKGVGELDDAISALSFLTRREEINPALLAVLGYSFGGMIAISAAGRSDIAGAVAAVSPVMPPGALRDSSKPKYIILGSEDTMIPPASVLKEAEKMAEPKKIEVIPGVDHFWWGCEDEAAGKVAAFFTEVFSYS